MSRIIPLPNTDACMQLANESSSLVDPAIEDPMDFIVWEPENREEKDWRNLRWRPYGCDQEGKGAATISILQLGGENAVDVSNEVNATITKECIKFLHSKRDAVSIETLLDEIEQQLACTRPFLAAKHNAWVWFSTRLGSPLANYRTIPRPGIAAVATVTSRPNSLGSEYESLSDELVLRTFAKDFENADEAVLVFANTKISDPAVLAKLTGSSEESLRAAMERLHNVVEGCTKGTINRQEIARATGYSEAKLDSYLSHAAAAGVLVLKKPGKKKPGKKKPGKKKPPDVYSCRLEK